MQSWDIESAGADGIADALKKVAEIKAQKQLELSKKTIEAIFDLENLDRVKTWDELTDTQRHEAVENGWDGAYIFVLDESGCFSFAVNFHRNREKERSEKETAIELTFEDMKIIPTPVDSMLLTEKSNSPVHDMIQCWINGMAALQDKSVMTDNQSRGLRSRVSIIDEGVYEK